MVLNKDEFLASIKERIGEDTSDASLKFLEDMTDTFDSLSKGDEDYKTKYEELNKKYEKLDNDWRDKYKSRFFESSADKDTEPPVETLNDGEGDNTPKKFNDLFSEKEN